MRHTLALTFVLLLAACGQAGELYLPSEPPTQATPPEPAPEETDDKDVP